MRTVKIASLYSIEVDPARKFPGIEPGAVRPGAQFSLHETSHLPAQHIVYDERVAWADGPVVFLM